MEVSKNKYIWFFYFYLIKFFVCYLVKEGDVFFLKVEILFF